MRFPCIVDGRIGFDVEPVEGLGVLAVVVDDGLTGAPASMSLTTAPVNAPPKSVWLVAADWMSWDH